MWIIDNGSTPQIISTPADANVAHFLRRDYPEATIYRCVTPNAYATAAAHRDATEIVYRDEERQEPQLDAEGNPVIEDGNPVMVPVTVQVPERVGVGNALAVDPDGPALVLLDPDGAEVGRLPLEPVA